MFYPAPPLYVGLVQFDNGARVLMEMVDVDPANFDVGTPLRMVYPSRRRTACVTTTLLLEGGRR
jgi:uncharacterized OB-fold protein